MRSQFLVFEFVNALISLSSNEVKTLNAVEVPRVAAAAALICRRKGCNRKAAALVAIAASSSSVLGNYRGAACLWYLGSSFTSAWNGTQKINTNSFLMGGKIGSWTLIRATSLKQLACSAEISGDIESALKAWVQFLYLQSKVQTPRDINRPPALSRTKLMLLNHVQCGVEPSKFGHLFKNSRKTQIWQQSHKYPPPLLLNFASFRAPNFARVNNSCDTKYPGSKNSFALSSKEPTLFFDPFTQKRQILTNQAAMPCGTNKWVAGERHSVALRVENPMGANVSFISAYLELCGTECIAHKHLFDKLVLKGQSTIQIRLDATPTLQERAIKLCGAWITMLDEIGNSFTSFHGIKASYSALTAKFADGARQKPGLVSPIIAVASPQPRIVARVVSEKAGPVVNNPTDYMLAGIRNGEDVMFNLQLTNLSGVFLDRLELWAGPLQNSRKNDLIFRHVLKKPSKKLVTENLSCIAVSESEETKLRQKLYNGFKSLDVLMHIGRNPIIKLMDSRITCTFAGSGATRREAGVAIMLTRRPGLTCIRVRRNAYYIYYVRNNAGIPIRLKRCSYDTWIIVRPKVPIITLRLNVKDVGGIKKQIQWCVDGAVNPELDGIGFLSHGNSSDIARC